MTHKNLFFIGLVILALAVVLTGCPQSGGAAIPTATKPAAAPGTGGAASGQAVFQRNCDGCHPGGAQGVGPSLKNTALTEDQIKTTVRTGRGQMPPFNQQAISDAELQALAQYVKTLR